MYRLILNEIYKFIIINMLIESFILTRILERYSPSDVSRKINFKVRLTRFTENTVKSYCEK